MTEFQYWASEVHRHDRNAESFAAVVSHVSPAYIDWLEQRSALLRQIEEQAKAEEEAAIAQAKEKA